MVWGLGERVIGRGGRRREGEFDVIVFKQNYVIVKVPPTHKRKVKCWRLIDRLKLLAFRELDQQKSTTKILLGFLLPTLLTSVVSLLSWVHKASD